MIRSARIDRSAFRKKYQRWRGRGVYGTTRSDSRRRPELTQSTLWQENKPAANREHPTAKPVELVARALLNSSERGDIVADLFGGSGSTLIACEQQGRNARLMEIDPHYVDVTVRRWQRYTGQQATLEGDGRTYEELSELRYQQAA